MHTYHNFIPYKLEEFENFYYSRCECGAILGSPIKSYDHKQQIINYLATHVGD